MMTQIRSLRAVVLPAPDMLAQDTPTRRLLNELGHDVSRASTPDHALELINSDHTDLLVVDLANNTLNQQLMDSLEELPESKRPEQVAIFTDGSDMNVRDYRKKFSPSRVHIFLKPLHMHGLLSVLRTLERKNRAEKAGA
jgi:DNA-binding NtrC family response regulator